MAELSNGGRSIGESTGAATIRPAAALERTVSAGNGAMTMRMRSSASCNSSIGLTLTAKAEFGNVEQWKTESSLVSGAVWIRLFQHEQQRNRERTAGKTAGGCLS